jgi:hypothetical protein
MTAIEAVSLPGLTRQSIFFERVRLAFDDTLDLPSAHADDGLPGQARQ